MEEFVWDINQSRKNIVKTIAKMENKVCVELLYWIMRVGEVSIEREESDGVIKKHRQLLVWSSMAMIILERIYREDE